MTSKIKEAIFSVFEKLTPINTNASPATINRWKNSTNVRICYDNLYKPTTESEDESVTYIMRIVEKVFVDSKSVTDAQIAYIMSVCELILDPDNENIQINESTIKEKFQELLVSFAILCR